MGAAEIRHQIALYLGGPYVPAARAYLTPTVAGLGVVRRSRPKRDNHREWHGPNQALPHGTALFVHVGPAEERRVVFDGPRSEMRHTRHDVTLKVLMRSPARYAEDAEDALYALRDALCERLRADLTLGSGGFEAGATVGFEIPTAGGEPEIRTRHEPVETDSALTLGELIVEFAVHQYRAAP